MPFRIALSGLNASTAELNVIANNVANSSTTGYKKSRAEFADIFASSSLGTTANAIGAGVKVSSISQQFTQGNVGFTDNNLDIAISGQGFFTMDDNGVRVYSRAGGFGVDREGYVVNSQAQKLIAYQANSTGGITGATGTLRLDTSDIAPGATSNILMGLNLDASDDIPLANVTTSNVILGGTQTLDTTTSPVTTAAFDMVDSYGNATVGNTVRWTYSGAGNVWNAELREGGNPTAPPTTALVDIGTTQSVTFTWPPNNNTPTVSMMMDTSGLSQNTGGGSNISAVANGAVQGGFTVNDTSSYNSSTSLTIYDSLGADHLGTAYFRKTGTPNVWEMHTYVDGVNVSGPDILTFSTIGELQSIVPGTGATATNSLLTTPAFTPTNTGGLPEPMQLTFDLSKVNQFGSNFTVNSLVQDGYATGRLSGVDISDVGVITARFTNGQSRTLGQIALARFPNDQGLRQLGDTSWAETYDSGAPLIGSPGSGSLGLISSGALEGSNVDLTEQLVGMITAQRNFQANAQVITTADTITQTIINIR